MARVAELWRLVCDFYVAALWLVGWPMGHFGSTRRRPAADLIHPDRW
jgi:hypothetical protein